MKKPSTISGFSLIEVAIGLMIIGLIMGPMITGYDIYLKDRQVTTSTGNIGLVKAALERYVIRYGCYPVPGNPNVASTNAAFGQEAVVPPRKSCAALTAPQLAAIPACAAGGNDTVMCQTPTGTAGAIVYIGDIPFATLGLPHDYILDGFGSKITYAVTQALTVSTAVFNDSGGVIIVHDNAGLNTHNGVATTGNIHYILVSHGKDKVGAFSLGGVPQANCGAVGAAADNENCNNDATFSDNYALNGVGVNAVYARQEYDVAGATHYDDFVGWTTTTASDLWVKQPSLPNILNNNAGNIRIGLAGALTPNALVDVRDIPGGTGVKTDQLWTNNLCDATGGCAVPGALVTTPGSPRPNVFTPAIIAGTPNPADAQKPGGGIDCNGAAMIGIANSNEICTGTINLPGGTMDTCICAPGKGGCDISPGGLGHMGCSVPGGACGGCP